MPKAMENVPDEARKLMDIKNNDGTKLKVKESIKREDNNKIIEDKKKERTLAENSKYKNKKQKRAKAMQNVPEDERIK